MMSSNEEFDECNDPYYVGKSAEGRVEIFQSDNPADATPEASGYEKVEGPYDSKQDAEEVATSWQPWE